MAKELSELKRIRMDSGINPKKIAEYLNLSYNHYLLKENGKRESKNEEDNEQFFYDVCHCIEKLKKEEIKKTSSIVDNLIEDSDKLKGLHYKILTEETYKKIKARLLKDENLIIVSGDYYVDYEKVEEKLLEEGLSQYTLNYSDDEKEAGIDIRNILNNSEKTARFSIDTELNLSTLV